jgi:hypothetical protein
MSSLYYLVVRSLPVHAWGFHRCDAYQSEAYWFPLRKSMDAPSSLLMTGYGMTTDYEVTTPLLYGWMIQELYVYDWMLMMVQQGVDHDE